MELINPHDGTAITYMRRFEGVMKFDGIDWQVTINRYEHLNPQITDKSAITLWVWIKSDNAFYRGRCLREGVGMMVKDWDKYTQSGTWRSFDPFKIDGLIDAVWRFYTSSEGRKLEIEKTKESILAEIADLEKLLFLYKSYLGEIENGLNY